MKSVVYPCGYTGYAGRSGTLHRLLEEDSDLLLIDARFKPVSQIYGWSGSQLKERYPRQYRWAGKWLGNIHYETPGDILLADPVTGIAGLLTYLSQGRSFVLLCQCYNFDRCHLHAVVDLLETVIAAGNAKHLPGSGGIFRLVRQILDRWGNRPLPSYSLVHPETIVRPGYGKGLTISQPWAWLLTHPAETEALGIPAKRLENRSWQTRWRGELFLHAGAKVDAELFDRRGWLAPGVLMRQFGEVGEQLAAMMPQRKSDYVCKAIVGRANLVDVVSARQARERLSGNPWYVSGSYAFLLSGATAFSSPRSFAGQPQIFDVPLALFDCKS